MDIDTTFSMLCPLVQDQGMRTGRVSSITFTSSLELAQGGIFRWLSHRIIFGLICTPIGLCFSLPYDGWTTVALIHHSLTRTTFGVVCDFWTPLSVNRFLMDLQSARRHASDPLLVPLILLELACDSGRDDQDTFKEQYALPILRKMGCEVLNLRYSAIPEQDLVLDDMPRKLTQLANSALHHQPFSKCLLRLCSVLKEELTRTGHSRSIHMNEHHRNFLDFSTEMLDRVGMEHEKAKETLQNQVQMVCISLLCAQQRY